MTQFTPTTPPDAYEALTPIEELEEAASVAELAAGGVLRAVEIAAAVFLGLLVCPPLLILVVAVVVPFAAMMLLLTLLAVVLATPYVLVRHLRGHHGGGHAAAVLAQRIRGAARAVVDLAPHRIAADVRKMHPGR